MPKPILTRRSFLAAAGLSTAAVMLGCDLATVPNSVTPITNPPTTSPFVNGPFHTGEVILGEDAGTQGLPQPLTPDLLPIPAHEYNLVCPHGSLVGADLPTSVLAKVYFPSTRSASTPIPISGGGPFPVLLYAHAVRTLDLACTYPVHRDFTSVDAMLRHVASYGCIAIAPDLSFVPTDLPGEVTVQQAFSLRALVLVAAYQSLASLNATLFANQVDLSRVVLVGHSTGGGAALQAGSILSGFSHPKSLAYGLIAPYFPGGALADGVSTTARNLLVLRGTADTLPGVDPVGAYTAGGTPKTLVTIPGANHFGYTSLCELDNTCDGFGQTGTISRAGQQQTGAAYLAALMRYYALGDQTARPYLSGARVVEGLEVYGVTGIQVQAAGFPVLPPTGPTVGPAHP